MTDLETTLFLWLNASPDTPAWALGAARWLSTDLPALALLALLPLAASGRHARRQLLGVALAMLLAWLAVRGIRSGFPTARPFELGLGQQGLAHAATASFPSFHATVAAAWATGLLVHARLEQRHLWWLAALVAPVALAIAWSRVFLGLHFVSDVAVGLALGTLCAVASRPLLRTAARSARAGLPRLVLVRPRGRS